MKIKTTKKAITTLWTLCVTLFLCTSTCYSSNIKPSAINKSINHYINHICDDYHFNCKALHTLIYHYHYLGNIIKSMTTPFESKPYGDYRHYLLSKKRIDRGKVYYKHYHKSLMQQQQKYGVPANLVTAIIGIETLYGTHQGTYKTLDALMTLGFYYPPRAYFFKHELTAYLLLTREQKLNPLTVKGSYAGALGIPQFMPDSYRSYAVSYKKNQPIDLMHNQQDAITSIGNFLACHGWHRGQPIAMPIQLPQHFPKKYIDHRTPTMHLLASLEKHHLNVPHHGTLPKHAAIIAMKNNTGDKEYWLVFPNFQTILSYNSSNNYALAVYELSQAIRKQHV
jgi:membrane-bound lytic murein transglycosylase B